MELKTWMKLKGITQKELSYDLNIRQATLSMILSGKQMAKPDLAAKIEEYTAGEVTRMDMLYPESYNDEIDLSLGTPLTRSLQKDILSRLKKINKKDFLSK
jgi:transcriptional regulator with XRE-family HTH domain